jgi:hypothetical protein
MLFFRSEELLKQWLSAKHLERGAALTISKVWDLSQRWYHDRLSPGYHGRIAEGVREIFREAGLTSEFWRVD